jgi:drug/metabolite transporter (DMT)-like permease
MATGNRPLALTHAELFLVIAIWAGTFVATKLLLAEIPPALSALYRYIVASAILLALNWGKLEKVARGDYPRVVFLSLSGVTLYYLLQHYGIMYTNATEAAILISLSPIFMGVISWAMLGEPLRPAAVAGLVIATVGAGLVITKGDYDFLRSGSLAGNLLILLTAVSWAFYSVYGKKLLGKYSAKTLITYTTLIGTAALAPFTIGEIKNSQAFSLSWLGWVNLLYLGGLASVYGYLAWYRALARLPSLTVGSYLYFRPLLTGIFAALLLNEAVGVCEVAGGVLIIGGTYLAAR